HANLLRIDLRKAAFDRSLTNDSAPQTLQGDPSPATCFQVANDFLLRLRSATRGSPMHVLEPETAFWRLDFLTDDGILLPKDPYLHRRRAGIPLSWRAVGITADVWEKAHGMPTDVIV